MSKSSEEQLAWHLYNAYLNEHNKNYDHRNGNVLRAAGYAVASGFPVGIRLDKDEPEWPVLYIELPTGQVSFHLPQHIKEWDGHNTDEKWQRIFAFKPGEHNE